MSHYWFRFSIAGLICSMLGALTGFQFLNVIGVAICGIGVGLALSRRWPRA